MKASKDGAPIKVILVDDSPLVRKVFHGILTGANGISVVAEAPDPFVARDLILRHQPDVVVLDIEMPRMDGITFLRKLMRYHPIAVVIVSSLTPKGGEVALEAMEAGAVEVMCKPSQTYAISQMAVDLVAAVRNAALANKHREPSAGGNAPRLPQLSPTVERRLIAIGASTGGTVAIEQLLRRLPKTCPPIVVTQHMPAYITSAFAERLNRLSELTIREAEDDLILERGMAVVAKGGLHMMVESHDGLRIRVKDGPHVSGHRPSVDVLFQSVAKALPGESIGVILTGMGRDGAKGLVAMRSGGAWTIAQDEASSVVFGMPKEAIDLGGADEVVALPSIADHIVRALSRPIRLPLGPPMTRVSAPETSTKS